MQKNDHQLIFMKIHMKITVRHQFIPVKAAFSKTQTE